MRVKEGRGCTVPILPTIRAFKKEKQKNLKEGGGTKKRAGKGTQSGVAAE